VLVPDQEDDLRQIFEYIMTELGHNIFKASTREFFTQQIQKLVRRGAQGVILGCTEIELLNLQDEQDESMVLFPSAQLHITAIARVQAGLASPQQYLPPPPHSQDLSQ